MTIYGHICWARTEYSSNNDDSDFQIWKFKIQLVPTWKCISEPAKPMLWQLFILTQYQYCTHIITSHQALLYFIKIIITNSYSCRNRSESSWEIAAKKLWPAHILMVIFKPCCSLSLSLSLSPFRLNNVFLLREQYIMGQMHEIKPCQASR